MKIAIIALLASLSFSATAQVNTAAKATGKPAADTAKQQPTKPVKRDSYGRMMLEPVSADQFSRKK